MFVAIKAKDRTRVTSIASEWDGQEAALRRLAKSGELVCPGCEQLLWLRTGATRRRHFAHRSLADCPLERQSAEVLEIKALLYRWMEGKYPGKTQLEVDLEVPGYERPADLVVQASAGRKFAYWVFDRQQRDRAPLLGYLGFEGVSVHFINAASTLKLQDSNEILLTASQRDFIQTSDYDLYPEPGGSGHLHFINADDSIVSIYRKLYCAHKPNVYRYAVLRSGLLAPALISPKTGEIVFAQDVEARNEFRERGRAKPQVSTRSEPGNITEPPASGPSPGPAWSRNAGEPPGSNPSAQESSVPVGSIEEPSLNINGPFRCTVCGNVTLDWSEATPSEGTCVCRPCVMRRGKKVS